MVRWQAIGAANNAHWCDLVVRSHGGHGVFAHDAWTSPTRTPSLFPDAVTLIPSLCVPDLLSRIDTSSGCSIKDSFASLDLTADGFRVLFDARWIWSPAQLEAACSISRDWDAITDPGGLDLWEEAWRRGDEPRGLFRPELLSEGIVVLGRIEKERVVAGGILSRAADAVGISNVFTKVGPAAGTWSALAQTARAWCPGLPLIGYERGEELAQARSSGFHTAGTLRVWIANA